MHFRKWDPLMPPLTWKGISLQKICGKKIVSAHTLSGGGPIVGEGSGGGEEFEVVWLDGWGQVISFEGWGWVGGMGTIRGFWWTGVALQSFS